MLLPPLFSHVQDLRIRTGRPQRKSQHIPKSPGRRPRGARVSFALSHHADSTDVLPNPGDEINFETIEALSYDFPQRPMLETAKRWKWDTRRGWRAARMSTTPLRGRSPRPGNDDRCRLKFDYASTPSRLHVDNVSTKSRPTHLVGETSDVKSGKNVDQMPAKSGCISFGDASEGGATTFAADYFDIVCADWKGRRYFN